MRGPGWAVNQPKVRLGGIGDARTPGGHGRNDRFDQPTASLDFGRTNRFIQRDDRVRPRQLARASALAAARACCRARSSASASLPAASALRHP